MTKFWLIFPIGLFLALTLYQIDLPGLHYDEAFEVVPAMQLLKNQPVNAFRESVLSLFGKEFPLMTQDYIGALNIYGSAPFLLVGGVSVASLRSYAIAVGLLTLLLVYGFTAELSGQRLGGLIAATLLAVNPTFIFWTRQGIFVTAITAAIGVAAAWSWLRWQQRRNFRYALLGAFLFGLGLYAKLLFVWFIVALFIALTLFNSKFQTAKLKASPFPTPNSPLTAQTPPPKTKTKKNKTKSQKPETLNPKQIFYLLLAGALGMWPLLVYNLQTGGTFKSVGQNSGTSYYGVDNFAMLSNLTTRSGQLITFLNGGHFWYLGQVHRNLFYPPIFGLAFIIALWLAIRHKKTYVLIPFTIIGLVVLQSIVTVSALWITHFALIMVWPAIALATLSAAIYDLRLTIYDSLLFIRYSLFIIIAILFTSEACTTWRYHQALTLSGGLSTHSDAIYDMADWLDQNAVGPVVAMDWGLSAPVTYLTGGRVTPIEVFGYNWGDTSRFQQILTPHLSPEGGIFLWRSPDETIFHRSAEFKTLYKPLGLEEDILEAFYERSGRPVYGATQLVPVGKAKNAP